MPTIWLALLLGVFTGPPDPLTDFVFPWSSRPAPRTAFTAHSNGDRLVFTFDVDDSDIVVTEVWNGESTVDGEDRVELFLARDPDLADYWCLEIDPKGRVHDYRAHHYRQFDASWSCPGLKTEAHLTPTGYTVTGSIPLKTLSDLLGRPVSRGTPLHLGLFRAEFYGQAEATHGAADDNWISWARPRTTKPDFHTPSAFRDWPCP